jgi:hypothetical protein
MKHDRTLQIVTEITDTRCLLGNYGLVIVPYILRHFELLIIKYTKNKI